MIDKKEIRVFLPCRKGSVRVPNKNIRKFGPYENGLIELKINQLVQLDEITEVILSTDDEAILDFAEKLGSKKIRTHRRDPFLATSETSTDLLVGHAVSLIPEGHILWTHVTSPFLNSEEISKIIRRYWEALDEGFDSLMTVSAVHGFLWNESGPMNYDRKVEKWPRTQTIKPIFEINSGAFINSASNYITMGDRIGERPFMYETNKISGFDIDWEDDFSIALSMLEKGIAKI